MTTITVTADHIAKGRPDSCELCPVALAIQDVIPDPVWVDSARATFKQRGRKLWVDVDLPDAVTCFIEAFDGEDPVEPFSFELDYPAVTP